MVLEEILIRTKDNILGILDQINSLEVDAIAVDIGKMSYLNFYKFQQTIVNEKKINPKLKDVILFISHDPTINFGRRPENNRFLNEKLNAMLPYDNPNQVKNFLLVYGIDFSISARPGGPTYLGPGQLIAHPIVHCKNVGITTFPEGQNALDLVMQRIANYLGINDVEVKDHLNDSDKRDVYLPSKALPGKTGKYGMKIGSKVVAFTGLDFSSNIMYNGFSLFLNRDSIKGFSFIPACGYLPEELAVGSIQEILEERGIRYGHIPLDEGKDLAIRAFTEVFGYKKRVVSFKV